MAVGTKNSYGKISITDEAIAAVTGHTAMECYGIVSVGEGNGIYDDNGKINKRFLSRGIRINTNADKIFIDLFVVVKYGVSINAVAQSLKEGVKYSVENFTGMIVDTINVNIIGVKL